MPRGVKGSGPQKPEKTAEVEVVEPSEAVPSTVAADVTPQEIEEAEDFLSEPTNQQEFNEFITMLARNAAQQEIASLEQRVKDLEQIAGREMADRRMAPVADVGEPHYDVPTYGGSDDDIEEYRPAQQGGEGTPWYQG